MMIVASPTVRIELGTNVDESPDCDTPPEWAVTYARAAVRMGMRVPEIEEHLVSRGLSPALANRIVMEIVEGAFQETAAPLDDSEHGRPVRLVVSVVLGGACLLLAYWFGGNRSAILALLWVGPELAAIWIPELTDTVDSDWGSRLWFCGWAMLILYLGYRVFLCFMTPT